MRRRPLHIRMLGWRGVALALAIACAAGIGVLGVALNGMIARYQTQADYSHMGFWQLQQAKVEVHRMAVSLAHTAAGDAQAASSLPLRFDLLWSRINHLDTGERWEDLLTLQQLRAQREAMFATLHRMQDGLRAPTPDFAALSAELRLLEAPLHDAMLNAYARRQQSTRQHMLTVATSLQWFTAGFLALAAATGVLVAMLALVSRRALAARRRAEAARIAAQDAHHTLRSVMDGVPALISVFDTQGRYIYANRSVCAFSGHSEAELVGRRPVELGMPADIEVAVAQVLASSEPAPPQEITVPHAAGGVRRLLVTLAPLHAPDGGLAGILRISMDITAQRAAEHQARHLHDHDALTTLPNRARFGRDLSSAAAAAGTAPLALHMLDLDGFRAINDTHGQATGDALLLALARRLRGLLRPGDIAARLGGDEFAVLQQVEKPGDALALASRMAQALAQPYQLGSVIARCSASIGAVEVFDAGGAPPVLMAQAELALREARRGGRGRFTLFHPGLEADAAERRALQADLAKALRNDDLHLVFQPKFAIADRRMTGVEALLRWTHPERGAISPGVFVPLAEEAGMALALARYVLHRAARQAVAWRDAGHPIPIAVNLSAELLGSDTVLPLVRDALRDTGLAAELLEIEVTESTFISDSKAAQDMLSALRAMGIRVGLDDFGTGFSSLAYLQDLPIDVIKIDRSFVQGLDQGGAAPRIVETVVRLAHGLGATVVAEGVETEAQLAILASLGCDTAQGFLLARPLPPEQIPPFANPRTTASAA